MHENHASEATLQEPAQPATRSEPCEECLGSGGWYRYEPAVENAPGVLYLSCLECQGSGRGSRWHA